MKKNREIFVKEEDVTGMITIIGHRLPTKMRYSVSHCDWAKNDMQWCIEFAVSDRIWEQIYISYLEAVNIDFYYRRYGQQFRDGGLA